MTAKRRPPRKGLIDRAMDKAASIGGPAASQGFRAAMRTHPNYHPPKKVHTRARPRPQSQTAQIQQARTFSCQCQERR